MPSAALPAGDVHANCSPWHHAAVAMVPPHVVAMPSSAVCAASNPIVAFTGAVGESGVSSRAVSSGVGMCTSAVAGRNVSGAIPGIQNSFAQWQQSPTHASVATSRGHHSGISASASQRLTSQRQACVSAIQMTCTANVELNYRRAEQLVREVARHGANIILLPGLFDTPYAPINQAHCLRFSPFIDDDRSYRNRFQSLARELGVVLPISFYECTK